MIRTCKCIINVASEKKRRRFRAHFDWSLSHLTIESRATSRCGQAWHPNLNSPKIKSIGQLCQSFANLRLLFLAGSRQSRDLAVLHITTNLAMQPAARYFTCLKDLRTQTFQSQSVAGYRALKYKALTMIKTQNNCWQRSCGTYRL